MSEGSESERDLQHAQAMKILQQEPGFKAQRGVEF
jgi:hypothetical protein